MLETWRALIPLEFMSNGNSKPLAISCECEDGKTSHTGQRETFVVKGLGHPEITEVSLFREALGNLLARYLLVTTPSPALVRITPGFVEAARKKTEKQNIRLRSGLSSGTQLFAKGYVSVTPGVSMGTATLQQAAHIYAYDRLCCMNSICQRALIWFSFQTA